ncbi:hypothetical protein IAT40_004440 [Kwoniella sp. CBS 6097]
MSTFIRSKYQQYKRDNAKLVEWLARAAVQNGLSLDGFDEAGESYADSAPKRSAKQAKNAKKKAKAKAKLRAANSVHEAQDGTTAEEAESVEKSPNGDGGSKAVVTEVKRIFTDYRTVAADRPSGALQKNNDLEKDASWTNMFAELDLQDDDQYEAENLPDIFVPEPSGPPPATARITFAPEPDLDDLVIRMLAFFEDMHDIRDEIKALWNRYKSGEIDLITASVTTNTALELLRSSHDDVVKTILPAFDNDLGYLLAVILNLLTSVISGTSTGRIEYEVITPPLYQHLDDSDIARTAVYDHLLYPLVQMLGGMRHLIKDGVVPVYKPGHYGTYDPKVKFFDLRFSQRWHQTLIVMSETFTDYFILTVIGKQSNALPSSPVIGNESPTNLFFIDEIAKEMDRFANTKDLSLLIMIYCQVFIDINFVMGPSADRGSRELKQGASNMLSTLVRRKRTEPKAPASVWHPENEMLDAMFMAELEFWSTLVPATLMEKVIDGRTLPDQSMPLWEDMDVILQLHGKDDIFGGKYPENIDDSLVSFLHMMGYSKEVQGALRHIGTNGELPSYLKNAKKGKKIDIKSKSGSKGLIDHTQILPLFLGKYVRDPSAGIKFDLNALETLLSDIQAGRPNDRQNGSFPAAGNGLRDRGKKPYKIRRERKHRSPKFSILQLLSVLETGLLAETTSIRFDYISMHLRCMSLLKQVKLSADEYFTGKFSAQWIECDAALPSVVGYILQASAFSGRAAESVLGLKRAGRNACDFEASGCWTPPGSLGSFYTRLGKEAPRSIGCVSSQTDRAIGHAVYIDETGN